ncbi:hypothetical protein H8E77_02740 [bacterium]|nr:hypothetical protein [bacterium]
MQDNNQRHSLLDELDEEQRQEQERQRQMSGQMAVLRPVIEKMKAYANQVQVRGREVGFGMQNNIEYGSDEIIERGVVFATAEEKRGEETDSKTKEAVREIFKNQINPAEELGYILAGDRPFQIHNPKTTNAIIFSAAPDGSYLYYARDYSAEVRAGSSRLLSRRQAISLSHGKIKLIPDGFSQSDVENCFKFLLGKSDNIYLSKEAGGGSCFIATAVYGSENTPEVLALRSFRDDVLLSSKLGKALVNLYYLISPPVARLLSANLFLRNMVRKAVVLPIVNLVRSKHYPN